ncbi:MAG: hypothetical protein Kow00121_47610 [Elainellaceae cyanobacterium]
MAKRRNLKKEKALRNLAYARKFRKRTNSNNRFQNRRRPPGGATREGDEDQVTQESSDSES